LLRKYNLNKKNIIRKKENLSGFFAHSIKIHSKNIAIFIQQNKGKKVLMIAQKKQFKKATERIKVKRKLREAYRKIQHKFSKDTLVLMAKPSILSTSQSLLEKEILCATNRVQS